jgi:hypothetical protein
MLIVMYEPYSKHKAEETSEGLNRYLVDLKNVFTSYDNAVWDACTKYIWLERRFKYHTKLHSREKVDTAAALRDLLRYVVGAHPHHQLGTALELVRSYLPSVYNGFYTVLNPVRSPLSFPYENLSMAHMAMVQDMEERSAILEFANDERLTLPQFMDFLLNWCTCYNDKYGMKYAAVEDSKDLPLYIYDLTKPGTRKLQEKIIATPSMVEKLRHRSLE